jgi:hypothetical protein
MEIIQLFNKRNALQRGYIARYGRIVERDVDSVHNIKQPSLYQRELLLHLLLPPNTRILLLPMNTSETSNAQWKEFFIATGARMIL